MKIVVNILVFAVLGLFLSTFIGGVDWAIDNGIYTIAGVLFIVAAILKGIITASGGDDSNK